MINEQNIRLIFGLKLKQLRSKRGLSPKELAKQAGISNSYLNEIERGKKYPKAEKILALAQVLDTHYDELVSLKLNKNLAPIAGLLNSNLLRELPLDLFGIGVENLIEIISQAPVKVSAFISTLIDMARNYELNISQFYLTTLRSYQQLHDNYFEDIEQIVADFTKAQQLATKPPVSIDALHTLLTQKYDYVIDSNVLTNYPELQSIRALYAPCGKQKQLLINNNLNVAQKTFQLAKELGYAAMDLKERNVGPSWVKVDSFDQLLNNFKASYFAGALLINRNSLVKKLKNFFMRTQWDGAAFLEIMQQFNVSPETFMHRLTSILPRFFGLNQLFFLRFSTRQGDNRYDITKELHLPEPHNPHGNELNEHYCRRWISINILKDLYEQQQAGIYQNGAIVAVQRSYYSDSSNEYFCISVARAMYPTPKQNSSVTLGFLMNRDFKTKVRFWNDGQVPIRMVNETCERCRIMDCAERVTPPTVLQKQARIEQVEAVVENLLQSFNDKNLH